MLPYAYRAIQSNLSLVDVVTLAEAAPSLGAGWASVLWRVILPNLRRGILAVAPAPRRRPHDPLSELRRNR